MPPSVRWDRAHPTHSPTHLRLEELETRLVPYSASGNAWPSAQVVTISFVPDGTTLIGGATSNLFATLNARFGSTATWQNAILKAAQNWAAQTNINFALVSDDGSMLGSGDYQQGAPNFGDIRIGGYNYGYGGTLATAYMPPPVNNYSIAGDFHFNTGVTWNLGTTFDLATVAAHEFGHVLGLGHSVYGAATMYGSYVGVKPYLHSDDIAGIRSIYSDRAARSADAYDAAGSNGSVGYASNITSTIDGTSLTALLTGLDLTTTSDIDYYKFTAPEGTSGTLELKLQSTGLSLMSPKVTVYASNGSTVLGTATASAGDSDGATLTLTVNGITAGSTYYIKVQGAQPGSNVFNTGQYALAFALGTDPVPEVPLPDTTLEIGNPISGGGGMPQVTDGAHDHDHDEHGGHGFPVGNRGDRIFVGLSNWLVNQFGERGQRLAERLSELRNESQSRSEARSDAAFSQTAGAESSSSQASEGSAFTAESEDEQTLLDEMGDARPEGGAVMELLGISD